jgi:hypothetical protein
MHSSLAWAERTDAPARLPLRAEAARLEALRAALGGVGAAAAPRAAVIADVSRRLRAARAALAAPAPPRLVVGCAPAAAVRAVEARAGRFRGAVG